MASRKMFILVQAHDPVLVVGYYVYDYDGIGYLMHEATKIWN